MFENFNIKNSILTYVFTLRHKADIVIINQRQLVNACTSGHITAVAVICIRSEDTWKKNIFYTLRIKALSCVGMMFFFDSVTVFF